MMVKSAACCRPRRSVQITLKLNTVSTAVMSESSASRTPLVSECIRLFSYGRRCTSAFPWRLEACKRKTCCTANFQISDDSLICKVERKWRTLTNIAGKRGKVSEKQRSSFADELDKLFNILVCSCEFVNCSAAKCTEEDRTAVHINCNCARDSKSPQNRTCLYNIYEGPTWKGGKEKTQFPVETARQMKQLKKRELEAEGVERREAKRAIWIHPTVASIITRGRLSQRFAAAVTTATLIDYKVITPNNTSQIIT